MAKQARYLDDLPPPNAIEDAMTPAEIKALEFLAPRSLGASVLWRLDRKALVMDGITKCNWQTVFPVELTAAGRKALVDSR